MLRSKTKFYVGQLSATWAVYHNKTKDQKHFHANNNQKSVEKHYSIWHSVISVDGGRLIKTNGIKYVLIKWTVAIEPQGCEVLWWVGPMSVYLSVCLSAYIIRKPHGRTSPFFCIWPWLGLPLEALRYVTYFRSVDDVVSIKRFCGALCVFLSRDRTQQA